MFNDAFGRSQIITGGIEMEPNPQLLVDNPLQEQRNARATQMLKLPVRRTRAALFHLSVERALLKLDRAVEQGQAVWNVAAAMNRTQAQPFVRTSGFSLRTQLTEQLVQPLRCVEACTNWNGVGSLCDDAVDLSVFEMITSSLGSEHDVRLPAVSLQKKRPSHLEQQIGCYAMSACSIHEQGSVR